MQLALQLIALAQILVNLVVANPNLPNAQLYLTQASSAIQLAAQQIVTDQSSQSTTTPPVTYIAPIVPIFSSTNPISTTTIMDTPQLSCSLNSSSNTGAPSSYITLTWTSTSADSAQIKNSRVFDQYQPVDLNGNKQFQLSSESGENNIFTLQVKGLGTTTTCTTSVLTQ